jgi:hypothetical protein
MGASLKDINLTNTHEFLFKYFIYDRSLRKCVKESLRSTSVADQFVSKVYVILT